MTKLRQLGRADGFEKHWPHIDSRRWPGRELKFLYCHPIISFMILCGVVSEITILLIYGAPFF